MLLALGAAAAAIAVFCAAVAVAGSAASTATGVPIPAMAEAAGMTLGSAAAASPGGVVARCVISAGHFIAGADPGQAAGHAVIWAVVAVAVAVGYAKAKGLETSFLMGVYPPPRNTAKD